MLSHALPNPREPQLNGNSPQLELDSLNSGNYSPISSQEGHTATPVDRCDTREPQAREPLHSPVEPQRSPPMPDCREPLAGQPRGLLSLREPLGFSHRLNSRETLLTGRRNELLRAIVSVHQLRESIPNPRKPQDEACQIIKEPLLTSLILL